MDTQITEPLVYISQLFNDHLNQSNSPSTFDPSDKYLDILKNHKEKVVSINDVPIQKIPKNSLVRFRCMIQDTNLGQEMFMSVYEKLDKNGVKQTHCYRYTDDPIDLTEFDERNAFQNEHLAERNLVYCISPPGENTWTTQAYHSSTESLSSQLEQLDLEDVNPIIAKKFPIPGKQHTSAIIKFPNNMAESLQFGQLIEIIGIRGQNMPKRHEDEQVDTVLHMFTGVPVIHAISYHPLTGINSMPYPVQPTPVFDIQKREQLLEYITSNLGGDRLAAEFVLLQQLSKIFVRTRGVTVGNFTLNISGFPTHQITEEDRKQPLLTMINPFSKAIARVVENLSVHSLNLPLTIDGLNKTRFSPKNINENLESGLLQLVDGTVLVVDETVLEEGQLVDAGVRNFQALQNLIQNQTLTYEFPFSQHEINADISVLTLSSSKSMLPNHCSIRLEAFRENNPTTPSNDMLISFRNYIHHAKHLNYEISDEVSEYIQNAFVEERKEAAKQGTTLPTQEDLMLRMTLARLSALSFGHNTLSKDMYDYAVELDNRRKSRN